VSKASPAEQAARDRCREVLDGMAVLRGFERPGEAAAPPEVHEALLEIRGRLDQAEVLFKNMTRLRAEFRARARERADELQDRQDGELQKLMAAAVRREYEAARERESTARTRAVDQLIAARLAARIVMIVDAAYDQVRIDYYGLLNVREELLNDLSHYLPWRASMEDPA
jgi:hypothetical protein